MSENKVTCFEVLRRQLGFSQLRLAQKASVAPYRISQIENMRTPPNGKETLKLAKAFKLSPVQLSKLINPVELLSPGSYAVRVRKRPLMVSERELDAKIEALIRAEAEK